MLDPLDLLRTSIHSPADAVRWACLLEAIAPKPGNVYPGRSFVDMQYQDFVTAAELVSRIFAERLLPISERMLSAVELSKSQLGINVNLGIVLLMGPLVAADERLSGETAGDSAANRWAPAIASVLSGLDGSDGNRIYKAINTAAAGGLGEVDTLDVSEDHDEVDIVQAMTLAAHRDSIARQYATGFSDLIGRVTPLVGDSIARCGDLLGGIVDAHVRLLAQAPDSLIRRKNGLDVAVSVQQRAQQVDPEDPGSLAAFDAYLRERTHQLNPGTTADLIAAALYLLLRSPNH